MASLEQLHKTLRARRRPEDIAEMVINLLDGQLTLKERLTLERAAKGALRRNVFGYTSMLQTFGSVIGADKQVRKAIELFKLSDRTVGTYDDCQSIEGFIKAISPIIHKPVGGNDFRTDRLNKAQREAEGLDISKRRYNKKWRLLKRIEQKLQTFIRESKKLELQTIAKHGLAHELDYDTFASDLNTACFIAYYNARCNLRSVFTNQKQDRPFDEICEMLFNRCKGKSTRVFGFLNPSRTNEVVSTNWWAISHVYSSQEVLNGLSDEQKGRLLGRWTSLLQDIAQMLDEVWSYSDINKATMVVERGNDSSTWNNTAGAWNKARDHWMNLVYSLGLESIMDDVCFGKVLRLMAADVVAWHYQSGGKLDPNTAVWNALPLPWDVFNGKASCNKMMIEELCSRAGIDPIRSGWIAPRRHGVTAYMPTPELVHGVDVSNPFLATILKRNKYFSGKIVKPLSPESN